MLHGIWRKRFGDTDDIHNIFFFLKTLDKMTGKIVCLKLTFGSAWRAKNKINNKRLRSKSLKII